jgi:hypothetical protein
VGSTATVVRFLGYVEIFLVTRRALLLHLLLPGQYYGHDKEGYADPQLKCVLEP